MNIDRYFIKTGYRENLDRVYHGPTDRNYWDSDRIQTAALFQYDVYRIAATRLSRHAPKKVLDVGSGPPVKLASLCGFKGATVHLVDHPATEPLAEVYLPSAVFHGVDLEIINQDLNERFDVIICADVLEHLIDPDPCLRFIHRHLAYGGVAFFSTPERDILRGVNCSSSPHPAHVREWNTAEFRAFLGSRGFEIISHQLLPQARTNLLRAFFARLIGGFGNAPSWYSCQLAICRSGRPV